MSSSADRKLAKQVAYITALSMLIGTLITSTVSPLLTEVLQQPEPSMAAINCESLRKQYSADALESPEAMEVIFPGEDGRSYLLEDPQAKACNLTPDDLSVPLARRPRAQGG